MKLHVVKKFALDFFQFSLLFFRFKFMNNNSNKTLPQNQFL